METKKILENLSEVLGFNLLDFNEVMDNSCCGSLFFENQKDIAISQRDALNYICKNLYNNGKEFHLYRVHNNGDISLFVETEEDLKLYSYHSIERLD